MAKKSFILKYRIDRPLSEHTVRGLSLTRRSPGDSFYQLMASLKSAAVDRRSSGLLVVVHDFQAGWAQAEEIMEAVKHCRGNGKKTCIFLEEADTLSYYLASCFDRIYLPPAGILNLVGLRVEKLYLRNLLEFAGINPELVSIGRYKSAAEPLLREGMSEPAREVLASILEDLGARIRDSISRGRGMDPETAASLAGGGPWSSREAVERKLIDGICYEDEIDELLKAEWGGTPVEAGKRLKRGFIRRLLDLRKPRIALVCAAGKITGGESRQNLLGQPVTGARTICRQFREARKKRRIKAVVLRIDSPGGSASASDLIWREVSLTARKKPVICSMGNTAASGGYYIAAAAGHIFASPATLTGSIGVIGGKFDLSGALEKLLVKTDSVQTSPQAGLFSPLQPMSAGDRSKIRKMLRDFYEELFLKKVSLKLQKPPEEIIPLAEGRVWTGAQAAAKGLVDSPGGLEPAVSMAAARAGITGDRYRLTLVSSRARLRDALPSGRKTADMRILAIMPSPIRIK